MFNSRNMIQLQNPSSRGGLATGILVALLASCFILTGMVDGRTIDSTASGARPGTDSILYVDNQAPTASDENAGSESTPLLTVQEAVTRARDNKRKNISTTVIIKPGTYRETVTLAWTNRDENQPENLTPIIIKAAEPGTVFLKASDVWTGWEYEERYNAYSHEWKNDWGEFDPGWDLKGLAARREMVFSDGKLLTQVASLRELAPGTFYVDEDADKLYLKIVDGSDIDDLTIEVAVRDVVWDQRYEFNVTIDGLTFEHAATNWKGGFGGARFTNSNHLKLSNCSFAFNNWSGVYIGESTDISLRHSKMNHNGGQGWSTWRVSDFVSYDTETSYNNWRGALSDFTGWSVGNKLESMHGLTVVKHRAVGNYSRGLWLDYDIQEAVLDSLYIADNHRDGVWFEANPGPIEMHNSIIENNLDAGLRTTFTEDVLIANNTIRNNATMQVEIAGANRRWVKDYVTQERMQLTARNWTLQGNTLEGGEQLIGAADNHKFKEWSEFVSTLTADNNIYIHENSAVFMVRRKTLSLIEARSLEDFKGWKEHSGQDEHSRFVSRSDSN